MNNESMWFVVGLLAAPITILFTALCVLALRTIFEFAGWTFHFKKPANNRARAHVASVIYGADKSCFFILRNFAITFSFGLDQKKRWEAFDRLEPKRTLKVTDDFKMRMSDG